ncbi:cell division protein FtsL [Staphylococcus epidermidis]
MIYIFFLILILSIIYLAYKYISLYMEIKQVTIQLQDLKNDVTSNQVIVLPHNSIFPKICVMK